MTSSRRRAFCSRHGKSGGRLWAATRRPRATATKERASCTHDRLDVRSRLCGASPGTLWYNSASLGSSRLAHARARVNTLGPADHGACDIPFGETNDRTPELGRGRAVIRSAAPAPKAPVEAFLVSTGVVALGEMGDKTQLLALLLAAKFKRPVPLILGILVATLANHALAGAVGAWIANAVGPDVVRWVIGTAFILMAGWVLIPDKADDADMTPATRLGVFGTTVVAFFLAEMGDKTQIATVALAARFDLLYAVVIGTTLGMLIANVPAVYLGDAVARRVPLKFVRGVAALVFLVLGVLTLVNAGDFFGHS